MVLACGGSGDVGREDGGRLIGGGAFLNFREIPEWDSDEERERERERERENRGSRSQTEWELGR